VVPPPWITSVTTRGGGGRVADTDGRRRLGQDRVVASTRSIDDVFIVTVIMVGGVIITPPQIKTSIFPVCDVFFIVDGTGHRPHIIININININTSTMIITTTTDTVIGDRQ
jgi:hypothetical protein